MLKDQFRKIFDNSINVTFAIILFFIVVALFLGALQLFVTVWELFKLKGITGHYIDLISDVLTLYVLVELTRSLVEYFDSKQIRINPIIDAAIVFIIRELLITLFKHSAEIQMIYALSVLILVLGILRVSLTYSVNHEKVLTRAKGNEETS